MRGALFASLFLLLTTYAYAGSGWEKYGNEPVLGGGDMGTTFDICVLKTADGYAMYLSWRPKKAIAVSYSKDGKRWTDPKVVLDARPESGWEDHVNRPVVLFKDGMYHMWYTGQCSKKGAKSSKIGYATSPDGVNFTRVSDAPVLVPEEKWEDVAVMCPHVIWDDSQKIYKMWYSGGEQYEPNAIGYAESADGKVWKKSAKNPVFKNNPNCEWERERATACQVIKRKNDYLMFYIGFYDVHTAKIGMARSKDGIMNWERYPNNPIIQPTPDGWDAEATYKPYAVFDGGDCLLWYNGRVKNLERIGLAVHKGEDLGF